MDGWSEARVTGCGAPGSHNAADLCLRGMQVDAELRCAALALACSGTLVWAAALSVFSSRGGGGVLELLRFTFYYI